MAGELIELSGGLLMLIVSEKLSQAELTELQREAEKVLQKHDKARILVVAENFQGWERGADWADFSFQEKNDSKIECMALVGDKRWKELALAFVGQGLREFPIEYFEHGELAKARAWLKAH
jgi:SpoIIAA-like